MSDLTTKLVIAAALAVISYYVYQSNRRLSEVLGLIDLNEPVQQQQTMPFVQPLAKPLAPETPIQQPQKTRTRTGPPASRSLADMFQDDTSKLTEGR